MSVISYQLSVLLLAAPAAAQERAPAALCAPYAAFVKELPRWGEALVDAELLAGGPQRLEFWARPDRRSWSVLIVTPAGGACILGAGGDIRPGEDT